MRLLFVSPADLSTPRGGRAMLARLHRDVLSNLLDDRFWAHKLGTDAGVLNGVRGYLDGATPGGISSVLAAVDQHMADTVWLDGSNLGRLAQTLRRMRPAVRVLTFFHNVEARFFLGALRRAPTPRAAGVLLGNYVAERLSARHSDDIIALSVRDSDYLASLYGRGATAILPMAITDQLTSYPSPDDLVAADAPLLFVGGAFYANQAGIAWFARRVAPRIAARTHVVGHGMDAMRLALKKGGLIELVGSVDDLAPWYRGARVAIAPIFDGSGMKTKVAEALMFGKRIVGTHEAFSGYELLADQAGWVCETAEEFIAAIGHAASMPIKQLDPKLRAIYEQEYSEAAMKPRVARILNSSPAHHQTRKARL